MKIAIASEGNKEDSLVSPLGSRAPYYLIFEDTKLIESITNPFIQERGGTAWLLVNMLAEKGVDKLIVGKVGPNLETALKEKEIQVEISSGIIKDVLGIS
jgi:predicted Fe-Mo cluster-binding NifX family protein